MSLSKSLKIATLSTLALIQTAAAGPTAPLEAFVTEWIKSIKPETLYYGIDLEVDTSSKAPFGLVHLEGEIRVPLFDSIEMPLKQARSSTDVGADLIVGEDQGRFESFARSAVVVARATQSNPESPILMDVSFEKAGRPYYLPIKLKISTSDDPIQFRLSGIKAQTNPSALTGEDERYLISGDCSLASLMPNINSGAMEWKTARRCEYEIKVDAKTKKSDISFKYSNR